MKRTKEAAAQDARRAVHEAGQVAAPAGWRTCLDTEHPVKDGLAAVERHNVSLSGSRYEKERREATRLDFECYRRGGGAENDGVRLGVLRPELARLAGRRDGLVGQGRATAETDAAIESVKHNIEITQRRIAAAGGVEDQPARAEAVDRARVAVADIERCHARIRAHGDRPSAEDEIVLDEATLRLDAAERAFASGDASNAETIKAKTEAERAARAALATVLRERVLPAIGEAVHELMPAELRVLHLRRPEREQSPEVRSALHEAEGICATADLLCGERTGIAYLAAALGEELSLALLPDVDWPEVRHLRQRRTAQAEGILKNEPLMDAIL